MMKRATTMGHGVFQLMTSGRQRSSHCSPPRIMMFCSVILVAVISLSSWSNVNPFLIAGKMTLQRPHVTSRSHRNGEKLFNQLECLKMAAGSVASHCNTPMAPLPAIAPTQLAAHNKLIDRRILQIILPAMVNYAIIPLVGVADTFWVGRTNNALALAGQGAANQMYNSAFWIFSFLPSIITPLIAKAHGNNDREAIQERVREALFIATFAGSIGATLLFAFPRSVLSIILSSDSPAWSYAEPYLKIRSLTFLPALLATVGYAVFRGSLDVITPLKISLLSNSINVCLDPLLIFSLGFGAKGAAMATCISDLMAFVMYFFVLSKRHMLPKTLMKLPKLTALAPLLLGVLSLQVRALALNAALLAATRTTLGLDSTGTAAAAHAISMQMFNLGSVASMALSAAAAVIIPTEKAKHYDRAGQPISRKNDVHVQHSKYHALVHARHAANRLLLWSMVVGVALGGLQLLMIPLLSYFTPLATVQAAARWPTTIGAVLQMLNCVIWTGEGMQQGNECFTSLAVSTSLATAAMLFSLRFTKHTLPGVWISFGVLSVVRLMGVFNHHFVSGPLAPRKIRAAAVVLDAL